MYYVYAIKNTIRNKIYIGQTSNIESRLLRHNGVLKNKKVSFTNRNNGNWELVYSEEFNTRKEASEREKQLKSFKGREYIKNKIKK